MRPAAVWVLIALIAGIALLLLLASNRSSKPNPYEFSDATKAGREDLHQRAGDDR